MKVAAPIWTWLGLMLLLAATIGASVLPIGDWRQLINLSIAGAKTSLILIVYMKLRQESALVRLMAAVAGVLLLVFASVLSADYYLR